MKTITLDLGPGNVKASNGSPFEVSISEWKAINRYFRNVAATQTTAITESEIPAFASLKAAAVRWKSTTLPNLINLSRGIYNYGAHTVADQFPRLKQLLETMQSEIPANSAADFHNLMSKILLEAEQNTALAIIIAKEFEIFDTSVRIVKLQIDDYFDDVSGSCPAVSKRDWVVLLRISDLTAPPPIDVARVRGAWSSISDDLKSFQSTVHDEIASNSPFLAELNLNVAIAEWNGLAREALQFGENLSSL